MSKENKIIYISGPGYSAEAMAPIFDDVSSWCTDITSKFAVASKLGSNISIRSRIDYEKTDEYKHINAHAARDLRGNADYEVCLYASLIYNQWLISRIPAGYAEPFLDVISQLIVSNEQEKIDYLCGAIFYISSSFVICHELAHIFLGHVDWRCDKTGQSSLIEIDAGSSSATSSASTFAMEAEADALAASLLLTIGSMSFLEDDTLGSFHNRLWILGFSITLSMHLFENKILLNGPPTERTHPNPTERWFMFLAHLLPNMRKLYPHVADMELYVGNGAATAFKLTGLGNLYSKLEPIAHMSLMATIGKQLEKINLDPYRLFFRTPSGLRKIHVA